MDRKLLIRSVLWGTTLLGATVVLVLLLAGTVEPVQSFVADVIMLVLLLCVIAAPLLALAGLLREFLKGNIREVFRKDREEIGNSKPLTQNFALIGLFVFLVVGTMAFFDVFHNVDRVLMVGAHARRMTTPTTLLNYMYLGNVRPNDPEYLSACLGVVKELKAAGTKAVLVPIPADFGATEDNYSTINELIKTNIVVFGAQPARVRQPFQGEWTANHPTNFQIDLSWGVITAEFLPFSVQYVPNEYWVLSSIARVPDISLELIRKYAGYRDDLEITRVHNEVVLGDYGIPVFRGGYTYLATYFGPPDSSLTAEYEKATGRLRYLLRGHDAWVHDSIVVPKSAIGTLYKDRIAVIYPLFGSNHSYRNLQYYADIVLGILTGKLLHPLDSWNPIFIVLSILLAAWVCHKFPPRYAVGLLAGCVLVSLFGGFFLESQFRAFVETPSMIIALLLCGASMPVAKSAQKRRHLEDLMSLEVEKKKLLESQKEELETQVAARTVELRNEKEETERLLYNILPVDIARELKEKGTTIPRRYEEISIIFTDFRGFTNTVATMPANKLVEELNDIFRDIDDIIDKYGLEKIKTIGDSYMIAAGLPKESENHAVQCVRAAIEMLQFLEQRNKDSAVKWQMRVGIHSGSAVAGVVGKRKFTYDVWGDTVNIASRMETSGQPGRINISAYTYTLIKEYFECEYRGKMDAKGKGEIDMYFVVGEKAEREQ